MRADLVSGEVIYALQEAQFTPQVWGMSHADLATSTGVTGPEPWEVFEAVAVLNRTVKCSLWENFLYKLALLRYVLGSHISKIRLEEP